MNFTVPTYRVLAVVALSACLFTLRPAPAAAIVSPDGSPPPAPDFDTPPQESTVGSPPPEASTPIVDEAPTKSPPPEPSSEVSLEKSPQPSPPPVPGYCQCSVSRCVANVRRFVRVTGEQSGGNGTRTVASAIDRSYPWDTIWIAMDQSQSGACELFEGFEIEGYSTSSFDMLYVGTANPVPLYAYRGLARSGPGSYVLAAVRAGVSTPPPTTSCPIRGCYWVPADQQRR